MKDLLNKGRCYLEFELSGYNFKLTGEITGSGKVVKFNPEGTNSIFHVPVENISKLKKL